MSVGFIGLGYMGQGMADNLLAKGAEPVVYTRTRSKIEAMIDRGLRVRVRRRIWFRRWMWFWLACRVFRRLWM